MVLIFILVTPGRSEMVYGTFSGATLKQLLYRWSVSWLTQAI